jgi:alpha-amylase
MNHPTADLQLVLHNHQPVGNFDFVFARAVARCYRPTLLALERFPSLRITLHNTGPLLEWLVQHDSDTLGLIKRLADQGRIEILGGCMYEAIAAVLPTQDLILQVGEMRTYCREHLGHSSKGCWLAERVWDPALPSGLQQAGVAYTLVDDTLFHAAGIEQPQGHYQCGDKGASVAVFPIDRELRYRIPFEDPGKVVAHIRERAVANGGTLCLTYGDDGEKFGLWPLTFDRVFGQKWLEKFFTVLTENQDWLHTKTLSEAMQTVPSQGAATLAAGSYAEMMEWAPGGLWPGFLARYAESQHMHQRALDVSARAEALEHPEARRNALRAQCNDAYWHGLFGGLYLPHLRHGIYQSILRAQTALDTVSPPPTMAKHHDCVVLQNSLLYVEISPQAGGTAVELSHKPSAFCLSNVLARRPEHYHERVATARCVPESFAITSIHHIERAKEPGLEKLLVYDERPPGQFRDRFFEPSLTAEQWMEHALSDQFDVGPFAGAEYRVNEVSAGWMLSAEGQVLGTRVTLQKQLTLNEWGRLTARWLIASEEAVEICFAPELCLTLLAGNAPDRYFMLDGKKPEPCHLASRGACRAMSLSMVDDSLSLRIDLESSWNADWWRAPIETVSASEDGFERIYQGSAILATWRGQLNPHQKTELLLSLTISDTG